MQGVTINIVVLTYLPYCHGVQILIHNLVIKTSYIEIVGNIKLNCMTTKSSFIIAKLNQNNYNVITGRRTFNQICRI